MAWKNLLQINSHRFTCGFCGSFVASDIGYYDAHKTSDKILICPHCDHPSAFIDSKQIPGVAPGNKVQHVPPAVNNLYDEARSCVAANAFTASVLLCRKLLMHLAVSLEAKEGQKFIEYVDYLAKKGYVPPNGQGWVDHIRKKGNEANHEIVSMSKTDAEELIAFAEMLLKFIYEFPAKVPQESKKAS